MTADQDDVVLPVLTVLVPGHPTPQGSIRSLGKGRPSVHSNAATLKPWRATVAAHLRAAKAADRVQPGWPVYGPVAVHLEFGIARPKTVRRPYPAVAPDLDKYVRAVLDCLGTRTDQGAGVIGDDGQVVVLAASKAYGTPGVRITVTSLAQEGAPC